MKNIYNIVYNDLVNFINESIINIVNEGRNADKARQKTLEVIRGFFNNASWLNNEFIDAAANPNHLSVIDYIENKLREWLFHANIPDAVIRLEPIIMNIALSLGFEQQNQDSAKLNRLGLIVNYIISNFRKEGFPIQLNQLQLNNTTYDTLNNIFGKYVDAAIQQDNAAANSYGQDAVMNPKYEVIEIPDYETAKKYGDYSCGDSKLCYTQSISTWKQYTDNGINKVYLILNKNWMKIPEEHGENTPYDEYGLSMIFVFIDGEGNIAYSNTRWNHSNRGNGPSNVDKSFSKADISKLLGVNFDSIFKPYSKEELRRKGYIPFEEIPKVLEQGIPLKDIFDDISDAKDGFLCVKLHGKYNFINSKSNRLLSSNQWFNYAYDFNEGFAIIGINDKWNYVDTEGNILSPNQWFDDVYDFSYGYAAIKLNNKWNFIDKKGSIISPNQWFDIVRDFHEGYARIVLNDMTNFINGKGEILSPNQWLDDAYDFSYGYAVVLLNAKYNWIDKEGKLVSPNQWFDNVDDFIEGYAVVELNNKYNWIDKKGRLLSPNQWFDFVYKFIDGYAKVELNYKYNFIDKVGKILSPDKWFDDAYSFSDGYAKIQIDNSDEWYFINTTGKIFRYNGEIINEKKYKKMKVYINENDLVKNIKKVIQESLDVETNTHENDFYAFVDVISHCGWNFSESYEAKDGEVFVMHPNGGKYCPFETLVKEIKRNVSSADKIVTGKRTNKQAPEQSYMLIKIKY